jgi:hypothetical protein
MLPALQPPFPLYPILVIDVVIMAVATSDLKWSEEERRDVE